MKVGDASPKFSRRGALNQDKAQAFRFAQPEVWLSHQAACRIQAASAGRRIVTPLAVARGYALRRRYARFARYRNPTLSTAFKKYFRRYCVGNPRHPHFKKIAQRTFAIGLSSAYGVSRKIQAKSAGRLFGTHSALRLRRALRSTRTAAVTLASLAANIKYKYPDIEKAVYFSLT